MSVDLAEIAAPGHTAIVTQELVGDGHQHRGAAGGLHVTGPDGTVLSER
jgi:hypothetical protein